MRRMAVAPYRSDMPRREDQWIYIADQTNKPLWSPDGNVFYYTSEADGFRCIRAQRLNPATKRPVGPPIEVYHSHNPRRSLANGGIAFVELAITANKLFFNLGETTGNIWMAE